MSPTATSCHAAGSNADTVALAVEVAVALTAAVSAAEVATGATVLSSTRASAVLSVRSAAGTASSANMAARRTTRTHVAAEAVFFINLLLGRERRSCAQVKV